MLSENTESTIQEERTHNRSDKKRQKNTARLIWASKPRNLISFFDSGEDEIFKQPNRLIWGDNLRVTQALLAQGCEEQKVG